MQYALRAYWAGSDEGELERDVESARSYPAKFLNGHLRALLNGWYPAADVDYRKLPNEPTGMMRFLRTFQRGVAGSVLGILRAYKLQIRSSKTGEAIWFCETCTDVRVHDSMSVDFVCDVCGTKGPQAAVH